MASEIYKQLALVLCVALFLRIAFACWWQWGHLPDGQPFEFPDSESYWELGQSIATGQPYQFRTEDQKVFRTPGYPLILAAGFRVFGVNSSPLWARMLGAVLGTLTVAAVFWLAKDPLGAGVGLLSAGIVAIYPGAIATSTFVLAEAPFCLFMLLQLAAWNLALRSEVHKKRLLWSATAGVLAGIACLIRPSWMLFTPIGILLWLAFGKPKSRIAVGGVVMLTSLVLMMAPWWIRNWRVTGCFVPTTLQVGASLYDGLREDADGGSDMQFVDDFRTEIRHSDQQSPIEQPPFEVRLDRRMRAAAWDWAVAHPAECLGLAGKKFARMWNVWPNEPSFRNWPVRLGMLFTYLPVMILAAWGLWICRGQPGVWLICLGPAVYFTLLHVIFVGSIRYRQPAVLTLAILAAAALASLLGIPRNRTNSNPLC